MSVSKLNLCKSFRVAKAKFLGSLPGYDESWMRNVDLGFYKASSGSAEFHISQWWLGITADHETRVEFVPFRVADRKITTCQGQLQVRLDGRADSQKRRLSDVKIFDDDALLQSIQDFILRCIIEGKALDGSCRIASPQVAFVEDKENMSSSSSASAMGRQRVMGKPIVSAAGISVGSFYGSSAQPRSNYSTSTAFSQSPKPTQSLHALRTNYAERSSPSPSVGSADRPIPTFRMPAASGANKPANTTKSFTQYGARNGLSSEPSSGRNSIFGSGPNYPTAHKSPCRTPTKTTSSTVNDSIYNFDELERPPSTVPSPDLRSWDSVTSTSVVPAKPSSPSSPMGLLNLGNSCYMNAVLQALFAQPSFNYDMSRINVDDVLSVSAANLVAKGTEPSTSLTNMRTASSAAEASSLILCVLNLLQSCSRTPTDSIERQKARLLAVKTASKKFIDSQQHDAQEFLCCMLDDLKEEHRRSFTAMKGATSELSEAEINEAELLANPVAANFDFTLRKSLSCRQCNRVASEQVESFNNLSVHIPNAEVAAAALQSREQKNLNSTFNDDLDLPILLPTENASTPPPTGKLNEIDSVAPNDISLQDCFDNFYQKEEIQYRSEVCGHDLGGVVSYSLASLPRVFVIHLKRFLYTVTSNVGTKCTQPVTIPLELDLSKYCAQNVKFPKLVDSPLTPKEAMKSEILSPAKLSPPPSATASTPRAATCRKRLLNFGTEEEKSDVFGDENVPVSSAQSKRYKCSPDDAKARRLSPTAGGSTLATSTASSVSTDDDVLQKLCKYRLSAVISHTGSSSDYGHYTTDAYHSTLKRWFRFDDMAVKGISETNVLEENKWNGYIFFYTASPVWDLADALIISPNKT